ncbi:DUF397 domain-containing protein [Streptomyces sp. NPDC088923]|uniref:DUF397 domain-containing protein n=1 Tax=Streptomyces sp. NPDC088923 TaxID=3365913 RepID=UPI00382EE200
MIRDASRLPVTWWKSSASGTQGDCVECGGLGARAVAVRDSKRPSGPALVVSPAALTAFATAAGAGTLGA